MADTVYVCDGRVKEFTLPDGESGDAILVTSPGGDTVAVLRDSTYTVRKGTLRFLSPPPRGTKVTLGGDIPSPVDVEERVKTLEENWENLMGVDTIKAG